MDPLVTVIIIAELVMASGIAGSLTRSSSSVRALRDHDEHSSLRFSLVSRAVCLVALLASIAVLALLQGTVE